MALLQSGRGVFPLLSPKVKPVTDPGRVTNRGIGPESSPAFGYIFIFENRKARNEGDRAERVGSGRSRCRERSRGDRRWVVRKSRESTAPRPFPPGMGSRTPPAGQGRGRRGRPGPLPERRARPRKQGGAIPLNSKTQRLLLLIHWPKLFGIFSYIYKLKSACFS